MNTNILYILFASLLFSLSCKKSDQEVNPPLSSARNNAFAEAQFNDVSMMVDQAINLGAITGMAGVAVTGSGTNGPAGASCAVISLDTLSLPHKLVIDFGAVNCVGVDGRARRGKILAQFDGNYPDQGTVINISFQEYFVNDHRIAGSKQITNMGLNAAGNRVFKIEVNGSVIKPGGLYFTWNSVRFREWKEGSATPLNPLDDLYVITGSTSGINTDGTSFSFSIIKPLVRRLLCNWFECGAIELTQPGVPKITIDFGNTGCDNNASISVRGVSYPLILE